MKFFKFVLIAAVASLAACGGGGTDIEETKAVATATDEVEAQPAFHRMPVTLAAPVDNGTSRPNEYRVPGGVAGLDTQLLTEDRQAILQADARQGALNARATAATTPTLKVYSPAQIRAAYGLAPIPSNLTNLSDADAAALGAGQTIYIITAFNAPNLLKDLDTFNKQFNLPGCRQVTIPVTTKFVDTLNYSGKMPTVGGAILPPAPKNECTISVINPKFLSLTATPPAYSPTWALETTMDVQWAHATAPLARIVVIQSLNNFVNSFTDALTMANQFGPGAVSMSFVAGEGTYSERYEYFLKGNGMTYVSASGDWGFLASWPATSPSVIAVGGTSLNSYDAGTRNETVWAKSGGGYSQYFVAPTYQSGLPVTKAVTGRYSTQRNKRPRAFSDVAFNADPYTGQYVAFTPAGRTTPTWYSMGGTSIGTPQFAGIVTIANAQRALKGLPTMGKFHDKLYGYYGTAFSDITSGNNGTCDYCTARAGWDIPTGIGTPNVAALLPLMGN